MQRHDVIVVGAGHNGLVCGAYLARSGRKVLILEASQSPGGFAAFRTFHPGYRVAIAHTVGHFSRTVAVELDLARHGYAEQQPALSTLALGSGGQALVVERGAIGGAGDENRAACESYFGTMQKFADALRPFWHRAMPRLQPGDLGSGLELARIAWRLRRLGRDDMREFLRVVSLPMRDLLDERFSGDLLKAALSWDGIIGSNMAPRSPNNAVLGLLYRMSEGVPRMHTTLVSGTTGLIGALCGAATASGAEIRCNASVKSVLVEGGRDGLAARGVELANGETLSADIVVSAVDPKATFLRLVGQRNLEIGFSGRIRRIRSQGLVGKLHLALRDLPTIGGLARPDGRLILAESMDAIEWAHDDAKYGRCPDHPVLEVVLPSLRDPALAPRGHHVLSAHVLYVPYRLRGGWTGEARDCMRERSIDAIARHAPGIRASIVHAEFLTPADLEQRTGASGGHWHHGEFALDQLLMMRPTYGAAQYATPLANLYLCGAGTHPAGDLTGIPGHNAARRILQ